LSRHDEAFWPKTGLEFLDGHAQMSVVASRDWSDRSMMPASKEEVGQGIRMRLTRLGRDLRAEKRNPDGMWQLFRLAHLDLPPIARDLHG
jgi:hypothetical protein